MSSNAMSLFHKLKWLALAYKGYAGTKTLQVMLSLEDFWVVTMSLLHVRPHHTMLLLIVFS